MHVKSQVTLVSNLRRFHAFVGKARASELHNQLFGSRFAPKADIRDQAL